MRPAPSARDRREPVLAAVVVGGATVGGLAVPSFLMMSGRTGAEYVFLTFAIIGPAVLLVAGLIAFAVYRMARGRLPHPVLAAITAAIIWGVVRLVEFVAPSIGIGLVSASMTGTGALVAAGAVFAALVVAVSLRRRSLRVIGSGAGADRRAGTDGGAGTGTDGAAAVRWGPRLPLAAIVAIAAFAAGIPAAMGSVVRQFDLFDSVSIERSGIGIALVAVVEALPVALTTAWAVLLVLLVDEWSSPRVLRAIGAGILTVLAIAAPAVVLMGGLDGGAEAVALGAASGAASGLVVFASERRRVAPAPVDVVEPAS
ncbi:hypothetical protein ACFPER_02215 [Agromyces aurantiacus]|uniref:Uncharacterized protein n=1 Tax=Agromyces aurantiacus TaxID=165814 RepID=A0ABV9R5J1_9MICO|nr:hypothetical protein [Agromyces aurantiacus]MBM7505902.1 hypothetical protein [Agromyces aurantiacus]